MNLKSKQIRVFLLILTLNVSMLGLSKYSFAMEHETSNANLKDTNHGPLDLETFTEAKELLLVRPSRSCLNERSSNSGKSLQHNRQRKIRFQISFHHPSEEEDTFPIHESGSKAERDLSRTIKLRMQKAKHSMFMNKLEVAFNEISQLDRTNEVLVTREFPEEVGIVVPFRKIKKAKKPGKQARISGAEYEQFLQSNGSNPLLGINSEKAMDDAHIRGLSLQLLQDQYQYLLDLAKTVGASEEKQQQLLWDLKDWVDHENRYVRKYNVMHKRKIEPALFKQEEKIFREIFRNASAKPH